VAEQTEWTLKLRQATTQRWTFALPDPAGDPGDYVDMSDYTPYSEIRTKEQDGDLVLNLTDKFSVMDDPDGDAGNGRYLVLDVLGEHTAGIEIPKKDGFFDIFLVHNTDAALDLLLVEAPVVFNPATTDMSEVEV